MREKIRVIITMFFLIGSLTACSGTSDEQSGAGDETGTETFRIYSLKDEYMVRQAASLFQGKYPDLEVVYEVGYTGEDGVTISDAIRTLNTELMSGNGPDVLVLDGLPADQYVEKGILEDVTELLEPEKDALFYNIITASNSGEQIYQVPTSFMIPILTGNAEVVSAGNIDNLVQNLETGFSAGIPAVKQNVFSTAAGNLIVTSGIMEDQINEDELARLFENLGKIADLSFSAEERQNVEDWMKVKYWADAYPISAGDSTIELYYNEVQMEVTQLTHDMDFVRLNSLCTQSEKEYRHLNFDSGNYFIPYVMLGLNHSGGHLEVAEDFLTYYLSKVYLTPGSGSGLSITRENLISDKCATGEIIENGISKKEDPSQGMDIYMLTPEDCEQFEQFIEELDTPVAYDAVLMELIAEQLDAYIFDGKDLQDAVQEVCGKAKLYMSE